MINVAQIELLVKRYEEDLESGKLSKPDRCLICKKRSKFHLHGQYPRQLIAPHKTYALIIQRLLCTICNHTFCLLPCFVAKFHRYAKSFIELVLKELKFLSYDKVADWVMESCGRDISTLTLYFWKRKFASG